MKKSTLLMIVSVVLALTLSLGGTLAYLQDSDSDVNVMTLGSVYIEQIEQEWDADKNELKEFTQEKPLFPYVGSLGWENKETDDGAYRRFTMSNVVDKYVSVKNTGKSPAYVRTIIALEMGSYAYNEFNMIGISNNAENGSEFKFPGTWVWEDLGVAKIDNQNYNIMVATHQDPVAAGATTIPSLLQVYLKNTAGNEEVENLDGNGNGYYDILTLSQAVQTAGFDNAEDALNTAFGEVADKVAEWMGGQTPPFTAEEPEANEDGNIIITNAHELAYVAEQVNSGANTYAGKIVVLANDIDLLNQPWTPIGNVDSYPSTTFAGTFDGAGHVISNLTASATGENAAAGLFGSITGVVKNVTVKNVNITSEHYAGGIVGYASSNTAMKIENCKVIGGTITSADNGKETGDKVGGIIGYCDTGNDVTGCTVENVTIKAYRDVGGIVGYTAAANVANITNNTVKNITIMQDLSSNYKNIKVGNRVGKIVGYDGSKTYNELDTNTAENVTIISAELEASTADELVAALEAGANVKQLGDITVDADKSAAYSSYGDTGVTVDGNIYDGKGKTLTVTNSNNTWDCAVNAKSGTIKNLTVNGAFRGIFMGGATGDVIIDNVVLDNVCYTFNSDDGNKAYGVYISNSTLNGWTSYSDVHKEVVFTNCNFGKDTGAYQHAFCRPYNASVFKNCKFAEGYEFDTSKTSDIVFENCYYGDTLITAENAVNLAKGEDVFFFNGLNDITIK